MSKKLKIIIIVVTVVLVTASAIGYAVYKTRTNNNASYTTDRPCCPNGTCPATCTEDLDN